MRTYMVKMKSIVIILLCLLLSATTLQAFGQSKESLQGKWTLERISAIEDNEQITISVDNVIFEIPSEIDIQQNEVTFVHKGNKTKVKYDVVIKGNIFCFPACVDWKITGNKLQLQWIQQPDPDIIATGVKVRTIILDYNRK